MRNFLLLLLMLMTTSNGVRAKGIDDLIFKLQDVMKISHGKQCELSIFEKGTLHQKSLNLHLRVLNELHLQGSSKVSMYNEQGFVSIRQAGNKPDDSRTSRSAFRLLYADKARLDSEFPLRFNFHLNKIR